MRMMTPPRLCILAAKTNASSALLYVLSRRDSQCSHLVGRAPGWMDGRMFASFMEIVKDTQEGIVVCHPSATEMKSQVNPMGLANGSTVSEIASACLYQRARSSNRCTWVLSCLLRSIRTHSTRTALLLMPDSMLAEVVMTRGCTAIGSLHCT